MRTRLRAPANRSRKEPMQLSTEEEFFVRRPRAEMGAEVSKLGSLQAKICTPGAQATEVSESFIKSEKRVKSGTWVVEAVRIEPTTFSRCCGSFYHLFSMACRGLNLVAGGGD